MVAGEKDIGHVPASVLRGSRVLRILKKSVFKRFVDFGFRRTQRARQQTGHSIDNHHSRKISAGQDIISYRNIPVNQNLTNPFVNSFIVSANDNQVFLFRQFVSHFLGKRFAAGRCEQHFCLFSFQRFHSLKQRFRFHEHSGSAAIRLVVHRSVVVMREITQINGVYLHESLFRRSADDALAERSEEDRRKKSDDVKPQTQSTTSTVTRS